MEPPIFYVFLSASYFVFTDSKLGGWVKSSSFKNSKTGIKYTFPGEALLTSAVSFFQSDIFEQLEHLYIPLFVRLVCILTRCVSCTVHPSCACVTSPCPACCSACWPRPGCRCWSASPPTPTSTCPSPGSAPRCSAPSSRRSRGFRPSDSPPRWPLQCRVPGITCPCQEELQKAGTTCPVCLETMHVARITPCGHVFHSHCLRQCLVRSTACPYCRAPLVWGAPAPATSQVCSRNVHIALEVRISINVMLPIQHLSGSRNFFISSNIWEKIT